jgi:hypothetical protein
MSRKIERDFVLAELATVNAFLSDLTDEDVVAAMSLSDRRDELEEQLAALEAYEEPHAVASIFFGGDPVTGSTGIESEFAGSALAIYQDIVSKVYALRATGSLAQRGVVPGKESAKLHITHVLRGSFGFRLEELSAQTEGVGSSLKDAVEDASKLMDSFAAGEEDDFVSAMETADERVVGAIRSFFDHLRSGGATFRLVSDRHDRSFDREAIQKAAERARTVEVIEFSERIAGSLAGILPESRLFEFRTETRGTLRGKAEPALGELGQMGALWLDKPAMAEMKIKQVKRRGKVQREIFSLVALDTP